MNCKETTDLLQPYTDGELDLLRAVDVETHMRDCTGCAMIHRNLLTLRTSIHEGAPYHRAPVALHQRIRSQVRQAESIKAGRRTIQWRWIAAAAVIAMCVGALWIVARETARDADRVLAADVTAAHVRSLMAEHLWDVKSSDQHTVKPWFDGKLDFAPDVHDFKADSFPLEGGRLDYLADRAVAALVYGHEKHTINLFIWPAGTATDAGEKILNRQGYIVAHWVQAGMNYWAVSDTSPETMERFKKLVREGRTLPTTTQS